MIKSKDWVSLRIAGTKVVRRMSRDFVFHFSVNIQSRFLLLNCWLDSADLEAVAAMASFFLPKENL